MSVFSSENKGLISIIIPAYNVGKYIEKCLDSIYLQTYQNFEIIVAYDEKSSDNTLQILENYVKIPSLKIYVGRDTGSGDARNRGFRYAKGEFVIFVDGDDEVTPDYLSTMIDILLTHSECNVVICNSIPVNEDKINKGRELAKKSKNNVIIYPRKDLLYKKMWGNITSSPWAYLVRRQYILDNPAKWQEDKYFT